MSTIKDLKKSLEVFDKALGYILKAIERLEENQSVFEGRLDHMEDQLDIIREGLRDKVPLS